MGEEPNLAMSGNNRFSAFFTSLILVYIKIQDGVQDVVRAMNEVNTVFR